MVAWPEAAAAEVLEMYRTFSEQAPPEMTCAAVLRIAPAAPWLPKQSHGKPIIALLVCHSGNLEEAQQQVIPLKTFATPLGDILIRNLARI